MSLAVKYAMNKRRKMAGGGSVTSDEGGACKSCESGKCTEHGAMVDRIMGKRMAKGGSVEGDSAVYEAIPDDEESFHETGANSGDELGEKDVVSRIMRARGKKSA